MIFKCKICGGSLEIKQGEKITVCEYCGSQQTLPKFNNELNISLYDRASHFLRNNEYDKAMSVYEQILNNDNTDAEAYWSLVLCSYGVEYVEDSVSHKRIPTLNRTQNTSIYNDGNYKAALKYADASQRVIYEAEANAINEIQKKIISISQNEKPYDIFICYKETDENGRRTRDSVLATELYHELTKEGFKVFFSRITLEDKIGTAYEPYIFAALNSAKVMVVVGTKPEHFNAVWVKNEWSRFLSLIKNGEDKILIPAYRDMDPYDLPEEFSHLQAQDMSKLGFMQDLVRGVKKILGNSLVNDDFKYYKNDLKEEKNNAKIKKAIILETIVILVILIVGISVLSLKNKDHNNKNTATDSETLVTPQKESHSEDEPSTSETEETKQKYNVDKSVELTNITKESDIYAVSDVITYTNVEYPTENVVHSPHFYTYIDNEFRIKIDYPAHFEHFEYLDSETSKVYATEDGSAKLKISIGNNRGNITSRELCDEIIATYSGEITYNPVKENWFAISIRGNDGSQHYSYYKLDEGEIRGFEFHFMNIENLDTYSKYIDHIYESFKRI